MLHFLQRNKKEAPFTGKNASRGIFLHKSRQREKTVATSLPTSLFIIAQVHRKGKGKMSNEELAKKIQQGENVKENMTLLCEQVGGFIRKVAVRYRGMGELEDLIQEGYLSLYQAIEGFNPASGYKFLTYAEFHMRQRMQAYIQSSSCIRLPSHSAGILREYKRFCTRWQQERAEAPPEEIVCAHLGISQEKLCELQEWANMEQIKSLESPVKGVDGKENAILSDLLPSQEQLEEEVINRLSDAMLKKTLWGCVDALAGIQPDIMRKKYQARKSLAEIGRECQISVQELKKQEKKALQTLRSTENRKLLLPFFPESEEESVYNAGLRGNGVERFARTWTSSTERIALKL